MKRSLLLFSLGASLLMPLRALAQEGSLLSEYNFLQTIPGLVNEGQSITSFPDYISGIFNFGIVIIGIAALVMITVGGFWYVTSAGNQAQATTAKLIITDAFLGLFVALFAFLILRTINPNLVEGGLSRLQGGPNTEIAPNPSGGTGRFSDSAFVGSSPADFQYCDGAGYCYESLARCESSDTIGVCQVVSGDPGGLSGEQRDRLASHNQNLQTLLTSGVKVKDNFPSTSLAGLPSNAVTKSIALRGDCNCDLVITAGTEDGHQTHGLGLDVVDFRVTPSLTSYMKSGGVATELSSGNTSYTFERGPLRGATVYLEDAGTANEHYHVSWE